MSPDDFKRRLGDVLDAEDFEEAKKIIKSYDKASLGLVWREIELSLIRQNHNILSQEELYHLMNKRTPEVLEIIQGDLA